MTDAHANFAISAVATAPSPASSGTSLVVTAGHGSRFPTAPFNAVVHPAGTDPTPANAEVVRVTARSTDTLTITRAQESSTARSITGGDVIYAAITAKSFTDVEAVDAAAGTGSLRTLGTGAAQALPGNTRLDQVAAPTAAVSLNSQKITNLAGPTAATDAVTKAYSDATSAGLDPHGSVRCATTANITLSGTQTIDGIAVVATDRVLVKNQTTTTENGIYSVGAGAWSRATDADTGAELTGGTFTFVEQGSALAETGWVATHNGTPTLGTDSITFTQFSATSATLVGEVTGPPSATTINVRERLERYVDYVNGLDANDGKTPYRAMKTIQAAYNGLKTVANASYTTEGARLGVGKIELLPGDHDVGTGVTLDWDRPVEIIGVKSGTNEYAPQNSASRVISSSGAITEFIKVNVPGTYGTQISRGFTFREITFKVQSATNTSLTKCLWVTGDHVIVERCSFGSDVASTSAPPDITAIYHEDKGDAAWARIIDNRCSYMCLYAANGTGNFDRNRIEGNVCFGPTALPMLHINANTNGLVCINNNFQGKMLAAVKIGPTTTGHTEMSFIGNGGEMHNATYPSENLAAEPPPFYLVECGLFGTQFIGGSVTAPNNTFTGGGKYVHFNHANAQNNLVIGGVYDETGTAGKNQRVVDSSSGGNYILSSKGGLIGTGTKADGALWSRVTGTYSASITPNVTAASAWIVQPNNSTAFTINAPTGMMDGQVVAFHIVDGSGGTMGNITWNAAFKTDWSNTSDKPFNKRSIVTFQYSAGTSTWYQLAKMTNEQTALHQATHQTGGSDALTGNIDAVAKLNVRKNSAGSVFARRQLNLIEGSNVTLTVADDAPTGEVDITVASTGMDRLLSADSSIGATSVSLNVAPLAIFDDVAFVAIDVGTSQCEFRRITGVSGSTVTFAGDALQYAHNTNDLVLIVFACEAHAGWWGVKPDGTTDNGAALNAASAELAYTADCNWLILPAGPIGTTIPFDVRFAQRVTGAGPISSPYGTEIKALTGFPTGQDNAVIRTYLSGNSTLVARSAYNGMTQQNLQGFTVNCNSLTNVNGILSSQQQPAAWRDIRVRNVVGSSSYALCLHDGQDIKIDNLEITNAYLPIDIMGQDMCTLDRWNVEQTTGNVDVLVRRGAAGQDPIKVNLLNGHIEMSDVADGRIGIALQAGIGVAVEHLQVSCQSSFTTTAIDVANAYSGRVHWEANDVHVSGTMANVTIADDHDKPETWTGLQYSDGWLDRAGSAVGSRAGTGTPEAAVTAPVGTTFHRTNGGANTSFYVKQSGTGNTGWAAK